MINITLETQQTHTPTIDRNKNTINPQAIIFYSKTHESQT